MPGAVNVSIRWTRPAGPVSLSTGIGNATALGLTTGVGGSSAPVITSPSFLVTGTVGSVYPTTYFTATGTAPITWSITAGTLPTGMSFSSGGVLSGTPTATSSGSITFTATNTYGSDSRALTLTVSASSGPTLITSPYIYEYTAQSGNPPGGANITTTTVGKLLICRFGNYTLDLDDVANTDRYPLQRTYQWYRNGVAISGAIGSTYPVVAADSGTAITCVESVFRVAALGTTYSFTTSNSVVPSGTRDAALVYQDNLQYLGSFRLPNSRGDYASDFEGYGRNVNAAWDSTGDSNRGSLFVDSYVNGAYVGTAEVSPPRNVDGTINFVTDPNPANLPRGSLLQAITDVNEWARNTTYFPADANGVLPLGKVIYNGKLVESAAYYYNGVDPQVNSHASRPKTLATNNFTNVVGVRSTSGTYSVSSRAFGGKMCLIPSTTVGGVNYQTALGGKALTGTSGMATVATGPVSYSFGSAAFDPDQILTNNPVTAYPLVMYASQSLALSDGSGALPNPIFQLSQGYQADKCFQAIPFGTRSLLFGGIMGDGATLYGTNGGLVSGGVTFRGVSGVSCRVYDPNGGGSGFHSYPYRMKFYAFDLADMAQVKAGTKALDSMQPYARWDMVLPYSNGDESVANNAWCVYNSNDRILLIGRPVSYGSYTYEGDMVVHGYRVTNAV